VRQITDCFSVVKCEGILELISVLDEVFAQVNWHFIWRKYQSEGL